MSDMMTFPPTVEEFMEMYKMVDRKEIYSNGTEYVPIFRIKQWLEHVGHSKKWQWIPCSERLPKVGGRVLLCSTNGNVFTGFRDIPELIWQVTEEDGRKHWVYDPESYTDDIESLPEAKDCSFSRDSEYGVVAIL